MFGTAFVATAKHCNLKHCNLTFVSGDLWALTRVFAKFLLRVRQLNQSVQFSECR